MTQTGVKNNHSEEIVLHARSGMGPLVLNIILVLLTIAVFIQGIVILGREGSSTAGIVMLVVGGLYLMVSWIPFLGLKILKPQEALVLTLFGRYIGTLKGDGFFSVNPFVSAVNPAAAGGAATAVVDEQPVQAGKAAPRPLSKAISLKAMTLVNNKQKVNDELGNPVEIGIIVVWRVINTAKAVFNVDNYKAYLSIQCDSVLRDVAKKYPYDVAEDGEMSLRGSSQKFADELKRELQSRVELAGLEIVEARITHLAYSPEIAAVMLQRQQASAIIDARKMIVDGAVGMVEMALDRLRENEVVHLDEERKAAMVSNLLVILCGNRDAQPVVNSGSLY